MRIIHLISGGDVGGAKTHVYTLLKELNKHIDVELICLTEGAFYNGAVALGIPATLFTQKSRLDFSVLTKLAKKINTEGVDILHCHGARANFLGSKLKKKVSIPVITTIHSDFRQDFSHSFYKEKIFTWLNRRSLMDMDHYLCVSNVMKQVMIEEAYDETKMHTIYNGIETDYEGKVYDLEDHSSIVFGCATRFVQIKGTDVLLKATNRLVQKGFNPVVKIAGHGDPAYTKELKDYVKENDLDFYVEFLGFVKDMDAFYASIDVNILPSYTEGFPYSLLEGGARGIATVASSAGGIVEMIDDGVNGRLFPPGDDNRLALIMEELMHHKEALIPLGEQFRQKVEEQFSDVAMGQKHIEIYQKIIRNS